jgi:multicomponent Na+:H+ antiporter subunit D
MAYGFGPAEERVNRYYLPTFILFLTTGVKSLQKKRLLP